MADRSGDISLIELFRVFCVLMSSLLSLVVSARIDGLSHDYVIT